MSRYRPNDVVLTIAIVALLSGCAIYLVARPTSFFSVDGAMTIAAVGPLPSFFHTLAFALMSTLLTTRRNTAISVIMVWGVIELLAEFVQHSMLPAPALLQRYQQASTFDLLDLMAILAAVIAAVFIVIYHHRPSTTMVKPI